RALNNPHVSNEAKRHARQMILQLDEDQAREELSHQGVQHLPYHRHHECSPSEEIPSLPQERINAARGYKAALHNPLVSEEGKEHARKMLAEIDDEEARQALYCSSERHKNPMRVAAGLKAAQHNPRVSDEGHHQAAEKLRRMGHENPDE
ncbi:hypothetical protein AOCH_001356, partial [Aspergillus ochraceoroseus]